MKEFFVFGMGVFGSAIVFAFFAVSFPLGRYVEIACTLPALTVAYQDSMSLKYRAGEIATADEIHATFYGDGYTLDLSGPQARFLAMVVALDGLK